MGGERKRAEARHIAIADNGNIGNGSDGQRDAELGIVAPYRAGLKTLALGALTRTWAPVRRCSSAMPPAWS